MQGWRLIFWVYMVSMCFRSETNFVWSGLLHSNNCLASSVTHWHEGHSFEPWHGWALDAHNGNLSWINRMILHWSSIWKEDSAQLTTSSPCCQSHTESSGFLLSCPCNREGQRQHAIGLWKHSCILFWFQLLSVVVPVGSLGYCMPCWIIGLMLCIVLLVDCTQCSVCKG